MLKTSEMTLKTPGNHLSFGLNGSHKARKFFCAKAPGFCPPPDISKASQGKEFQPIMPAHDRQNGRNLLAVKSLRNRTFSKKHNVLDIIQSITQLQFTPAAIFRQRRRVPSGVFWSIWFQAAVSF